MSKLTAAVVAAAVLVTAAAVGPAAAKPKVKPGASPTVASGPCVSASATGGEWRSYGGDVRNTRSQPAESTLGASNVRGLREAFRIDSAEGLDGGVFQNTPVVADGCLFGANTAGWVFAADAGTGAMRWKTKLQLDGGDYTYPNGVVVGSVAVEHGLVYVAVNQLGKPFLAALDEQTGVEQWRSYAPSDPTAHTYGSPIVYPGKGSDPVPLVLYGLLGDPTKTAYRGAVAIVDTRTKQTTVTPVIPDADYCQDPKCNVGFGGGSVWNTGAIDAATGYAYYGTGNPSASGPSHPNTNALIKLDIDAGRPTFGQIVGVYAGTADNLVDPSLDENPVCRNVSPEVFYPANSATCVHMDLDFGASPNLFRGSDGRLLIGALQKAGRFHTADAGDMKPVWETIVGTPCFPCNAASSAFDGERIITVAAPPGQVFGLGRDRGERQWVSPVLDGFHYDAISTANGVSYTFDGDLLHAYDNVTGAELAAVRVGGAPSAGTPVEPPAELSDRAVAGALNVASGGVAVAGGTVYVAANSTIVALRIGATPPTAAPSPEPSPSGGSSNEPVGCEAVGAPGAAGSCTFTTRNPGGTYLKGIVSQTSGSFDLIAEAAGCRIMPISGYFAGGSSGTGSAYRGVGPGALDAHFDGACTYRLTVNADGVGGVFAGQTYS
jgi:outer membrane protein assembly factor BamB